MRPLARRRQKYRLCQPRLSSAVYIRRVVNQRVNTMRSEFAGALNRARRRRAIEGGEFLRQRTYAASRPLRSVELLGHLLGLAVLEEGDLRLPLAFGTTRMATKPGFALSAS